MRRVLESREIDAGLAKAGYSGVRSSNVSDPTASAMAAIEVARDRLNTRVTFLAKLKACASELIDHLPKESWLQVMSLHFLDGHNVKVVARMSGYSTRNIYKLMEKTYRWLDMNVIFGEVLLKHFPDGPGSGPTGCR